jgi:hypothetical protein
VPIEHSKVFNFFLKRGGKIFATVTGNKFFNIGLELPCTLVTACEEFYTSLISNKQTRFLSILKNLAAACFLFSSDKGGGVN